MVGFDELKNKVTDALGNEEQTDSGLDKASDFINEKTGDQHSDKVQQGRDFLDGKVGDGGEGDTPNENEGETPNENPNQG